MKWDRQKSDVVKMYKIKNKEKQDLQRYAL